MSANTLARRIRPQAGSTTSARVDRGTIALAAILVIAPVLRMLGIIAHPLDTTDAAATLTHIDDVAARWAIVHLLEPYSVLLLAVAGFGLLRPVPDKGRRLASVGAVLFALGASALAMLVYSHGEAYLFMTHPSVNPADVTALYTRFNEGMPLAAPFIPMYMLGALLLGAGLFRSGNVSRVAALVFAVSPFIPNAIPQEDSLILAGIVGSAPMIAAMAVFALALVRRARATTPAAQTAAAPA